MSRRRITTFYPSKNATEMKYATKMILLAVKKKLFYCILRCQPKCFLCDIPNVDKLVSILLQLKHVLYQLRAESIIALVNLLSVNIFGLLYPLVAELL